jgi:hypothetical protein
VGERGQKGIAGAEAVDDLHPDWRHLEHPILLEQHRAFATALEDQGVRTEGAQRRDSLPRVLDAGCRPNLVFVAEDYAARGRTSATAAA